MPDCEETSSLDELEACANALADQLDLTRATLADLLQALDEVDRCATETALRHLEFVRRQARRVLLDDPTAPDAAAAGDTFLGHLMLDYLTTMADPDQYFGPDAPDPQLTLAAAVRWGVSEGRLSLEQAERIQQHLGQDQESEE